MKNKRKNITFGKPDVGTKEIAAIKKVILSKWIGTGAITHKFENKFKNYKKANFALAVNSCTAALHLSLISLGIKKGDEVITTPMTFSSTISSIVHTGATPVLADINPDTFNIDPDSIIKKITNKTKAIIIVHLGGLSCDLDKILKIKKNYNLFLIEDCAHAVESKYRNKHLGTFGDAGCFSFYSTKNLTTGEGGMILFKDNKLYNKAKIMSLHGLSKDAWKRKQINENIKNKNENFHYDVKEIGYKYNLTDLSASMGLVQLEKLEKNLKKRKLLYDLYCKKLKNLPLKKQIFNTKKNRHGCHLLIIVLDKFKTDKNRDDLFKYLTLNKISCGINYRSVTDMSAFRKYFSWDDNTCVKSKHMGDNTLSLPLYPTLKSSEVNYICKKIVNFFMD